MKSARDEDDDLGSRDAIPEKERGVEGERPYQHRSVVNFNSSLMRVVGTENPGEA